jgi:hypothetical protein
MAPVLKISVHESFSSACLLPCTLFLCSIFGYSFSIKMRLLNGFVTVTLLATARISSGSYSEDVHGYNLLGDHFGGIPLGNATFDYIIIGGGTAGLAIAARLADGGAGTVAVIEGGGFYEQDNGNLSTIPGGAAYFIGTAPFFKNPQIDWQYQAEPDAVSIPIIGSMKY